MTEYSQYQYDAWIATAGMQPEKLANLIESYGSPESCYVSVRRKNPEIMHFLSSRIFRVLAENGSEENMAKIRMTLENHAIKAVRIWESAYPGKLKNLPDAPPIMFYQGELECLSGKVLAMVGSRAASYAGQKAAKKLSSELSRHQVSVISGLACGIDAAAHQGCIDGGSATIAVTGCGLDRNYPAENRLLKERILENHGLILSEYAPGEKPVGWHFPVRNRIIVGLSQALVLIEARIKSGSMTSVQHALDQGKDVFVYPGEPDSPQFEGNHQLLREGGIYFTSAEDILEDLHWLDIPSSVRQNSDCSGEKESPVPEGEAIMNALKKGRLSFEQLLEKTGMESSVLLSTLTILQISGLIEPLPGKQYQIKH